MARKTREEEVEQLRRSGTISGKAYDKHLAKYERAKETANLRLRVDPALLAKLEQARGKTGRTLSSEIVRRLEWSFAAERMRSFALENAILLVEVVGSGLTPQTPPEHAQLQIRNLKMGLERIAAQLKIETDLTKP